jgi:hypothetical protein
LGAHAVVTLVITGLALAVTAGYLIHIARILWHVIEDLVVILGAVEAVSEQSAPAGPVIDDISRNLAAAAATLEGSVQRLAERRAPAAAAAMAAAAERRYIPGDAHRMPGGQTVPAGHHPGRAPDFGIDAAPALATPPPSAPAPAPTAPATAVSPPEGPTGGDPMAPPPPPAAPPTEGPPPTDGPADPDDKSGGLRWWRNR